MKQEIAKQWSEALRSGRYPQGRGSLARKDANGETQFCCLGVLCELAVAAGAAERLVWQDDTSRYTYNGLVGELPLAVRMWADVKDERGKLPLGSFLSYVNDGGNSFEHIANIIDKNWDEL